MAQRRMFSLKVVDTDAFLDMPQSSQLLYFHLAMRADDDGFLANPKKIMRMLGSQEDDARVLISKKFIIPFESGVCVIKHWRIHNLIRSDRYSETQWLKEKSQLKVDQATKKYSINGSKQENVIPKVNQLATQVRLGKDSYNNSSEEPKNKTGPDSIRDILKSKKDITAPKYQWQDKAMKALEVLAKVGNKKSSVFKCYKDNLRIAEFALDDCKELGKLDVMYFLKVYNERNKQ